MDKKPNQQDFGFFQLDKAVEKKPQIKKKVNVTKEAQISLIHRIVNIPNTELSKFYPRELKIAKKLFESYSLQFWLNFSTEFKINSLAFLLTEDGKEILEKRWREFNYLPPKILETSYSDGKIGEDRPLKKPNSLLDFLRGA